MSFYIFNGVFVFIDLPKYALTSVSYSESMVYAIPDFKKNISAADSREKSRD